MNTRNDFLATKPYLREVSLQRDGIDSFEEYPFSIPVIRNLQSLSFHPDVTFFIGENGSGKSTLMEALAQLLNFNAEGGSKNVNFSTRATQSGLYRHLKIVKGVKMPRDGYFLRAESFYNVASYIDDLEGGIGAYGGKSLHAQSHGESFLSLLLNRFHGNGLYLLDEPEAALSPSRQLSALAQIHKLVKNNSQFVIATHSPIIMAYPNARIYLFSESAIREVQYTETDHYQITRDFLTQRQSMLDVLLADE